MTARPQPISTLPPGGASESSSAPGSSSVAGPSSAAGSSRTAGSPAGSPSAGARSGRWGLPVLVEGAAVLLRPGNRVHVGSDPRNSLVLELPPRASGRRVAALLASMSQPRTRPEVFADLIEAGLTRAELDTILTRLIASGKARTGSPSRSRTHELRIRVHGHGPLTHLLATSLTDAGYAVSRSTRRTVRDTATPPLADSEPECAHTSGDTNLVVLADHLAHESWMVRDLMQQRTPHLQVRLREGVGLIGPLVLPGMSSCLDCADHHRTDRDPAWPVLAAQLTRDVGVAPAAIARATAALAHDQIEQLADALAGHRSQPPQLLDTVLELHSEPARIERSTWLPHPLCRCRERPTAAAGNIGVAHSRVPQESLGLRPLS